MFVAGVIAHGGRLPLWAVMVAASLGAVVGDQVGLAGASGVCRHAFVVANIVGGTTWAVAVAALGLAPRSPFSEAGGAAMAA